ncbi:MAG: peptidylprolyl isomerase [Mariniblastus sp.]|nr:peptidylprolyl isomerase [Mariniblastus sp.]
MSRKAEVEAAVADVDFNTKKYQVQLKTNLGEIHLNLDPEHAPEHCKNMIGLSRIGFYDGVIFHRVISGFMIQGGCPDGNGTGGPGYNVNQEFNASPHVAGVLSAARATDPNSAGSQFFVCLDTHASLDNNYTVFGKATDESMEVVRAIGAVETARGDRPLEDVTIETATVVEV